MELIGFAINMEVEGEDYYRKQAVLHAGDGLKVVFTMLADEESIHAALLRKAAQGQPYTLEPSTRAQWQNVFTGKVDFQDDTKVLPEQVDVYRMAHEMEEKSIALYKQLAEQDAENRQLYAFLIAQEQEHEQILDELIKRVNRPNDWVESAEFGLREEY